MKAVSNLPFTDGSFTGAEADLDFSTPRTVVDNLLERELRKLLDRLSQDDFTALAMPTTTKKEFVIERAILLAITLQMQKNDFTYIKMDLINGAEASFCLSMLKYIADKYPEGAENIPNFNIICQNASEILNPPESGVVFRV